MAKPTSFRQYPNFLLVGRGQDTHLQTLFYHYLFPISTHFAIYSIKFTEFVFW